MQERYFVAGVCPDKDSEASEGSREQVLRETAKGTGIVQFGEWKAGRRPQCFLQLPERRL